MKKHTYIFATIAIAITFTGCSINININPEPEKNNTLTSYQDPRSIKITEWRLDSQGYLGANYIIDGLELEGWVKEYANLDGPSFSFTPTDASKKLMPETLQDNDKYFLQKYDRNMLSEQEYQNYSQESSIKIIVIAAFERTEGLPILMLQNK
ncbi:hypothetical protein COU74_01275 [Candidatus Peregrinibacteria bacterium CG10_big_fil_rev_8_21_14_0_10_36_19]|nr:MAG: hypothetical protein COU74_01275 [Candidatus Peregrinibacteria bacterium CG10_big_fil_rev_8_21_14_0_10_36_19]